MSFLLRCPNCGERSVYEFRFGGEVKRRPNPKPNPNSSDEEWLKYSYFKGNEAGVHKEWWYHRYGCRQWFFAIRNTITNEVLKTFFPEEASDK